MNNSTYIFGKLGSGYTQYPSDSLRETLEKCVNISKDEKQIVVNRIGNMMYYTYVQYLGKRRSHYIGLSLAFSGLILTEFKLLYKLFEEGINSLAIEGEILTYRKDKIIPSATFLGDKGAEVKKLDEYLSFKLECLNPYMLPLPALNYSISNTTVKKCNLYINQTDIYKNTTIYGFTIITPGDVVEEESELAALLNSNSKQDQGFIKSIINKLFTICKH